MVQQQDREENPGTTKALCTAEENSLFREKSQRSTKESRAMSQMPCDKKVHYLGNRVKFALFLPLFYFFSFIYFAFILKTKSSNISKELY